MKQIKIILYILGALGVGASTLWVQKAFKKIKERDAFAIENKALQADKKALTDSVRLYKELSAKAYIEQKNAVELQGIKQEQIQLLQGLIKPMRDTVLAANKARIKVESALLECQKNVEKLSKKRR